MPAPCTTLRMEGVAKAALPGCDYGGFLTLGLRCCDTQLRLTPWRRRRTARYSLVTLACSTKAPHRGAALRLLALLLFCFSTASQAAEPLRIAVAANFKATLQHINERFSAAHNIKIVVGSASTGVLATQIKYGAPFDIFFAADADTPKALTQADNATVCYAMGRLMLAGGELAALANPNASVAIANPATAPYGRAAQEVLHRAAFRPGLQRKLVRGANVTQALQFWHSGAVDLALLPASFRVPNAIEVPRSWHTPIEQHLLVLRPKPQVDVYLNWLGSATVKAIIRDAGYASCP